MPTLSIVIPVYNEPHWVVVAVAHVVAAVERSSFVEPELIIVDDGSDKETREALTSLSAPFPLRIIHQENKGRFLARQVGVKAARNDLVLLLDSRVLIQPNGLEYVSRGLGTDGYLSVWNSHCEIELKGNPYARFWNVLTEVAYRDYCYNPRTMSYGIEEFDRYPKGTTCFLAPRQVLSDAIENFDSHFDNTRHANDDTSVIRWLAERKRINISPNFACTYHSRDELGSFLRHAFHRGTVFIDGWARVGGRFFVVIVAFYPLSAFGVVLGTRRPRVALFTILGMPTVAISAGMALRRSRADCMALGALGLPWLCFYAAGMWRGLWLGLRAAMNQSGRLS